MNILITGLRAPVALQLIRDFARSGHKVWGSDSVRWPVGRWSKYLEDFILLPGPRYNFNDFARQLGKVTNDLKIDHLIPVNEETFYISKVKDRLTCKTWCGEWTDLQRLHNKMSFSQWIGRFSMSPLTVPLNRFSDWESSDEYVFKPIYSRFASRVIIGRKICPSTLQDAENWLVQRRIVGDEVCISSVWDNGELKGCAMYKSVLRAGVGAGILLEPYRNSALKTIVNQVGIELNYTGFLSFDVIIDKENAFHFLECNPRATSGLHFFENISQCFLGVSEIEPAQKWKALKAPILIYYPLKICNNMVRKSEDVIFNTIDIKPALLQSLSMIELLWIKYRYGISILEATTHDIEWNNEKIE